MINIEPSKEFKEEFEQAKTAAPPEPASSEATSAQADSPKTQQPATVLAETPAPPATPAVVEPVEEASSQVRWVVESILIGLSALIIIVSNLIYLIPLLMSTASSNEKSFFGFIFGMPCLLALFLLFRSDLARKIIIGFMLLNIIVSLSPGGGMNIISIAISAIGTIFLCSGPIKRHF